VADRASRTPSAELARVVVERAKELGVLLSADGPDHNVLKIKPPMSFSETDAERMVSTLDQVLSEDAVQALLGRE
jgi:4-aminobutyrate aminotransferase-like enzyme